MKRFAPLIIAAATVALSATFAPAAHAAPTASEAQPVHGWAADRLSHAKELLGKYYRRSVAALETSEADSPEFREFIGERIRAKLPKRYKKAAGRIQDAILSESKKHGFDPIFLMAVIENESSFNPEAKGTSGEIGLMQLMPGTARWAARKFHVAYKSKKSLKDPVTNIRLGAAYLAHLRTEFDFHGRLYLAAYNMGSTNVQRALDRRIWPKDYPARVMQRYMRLYSELRDTLRDARNSSDKPNDESAS